MLVARDLQASYNYRKFVEQSQFCNLTRRRLFIAGDDARSRKSNAFNVVDHDVNEVKKSNTEGSDKSIDGRIAKESAGQVERSVWVNKRRELRENLEKIGFNDSWYANKVDKTECERRVYERGRKCTQITRERDRLGSFLARWKKRRVSAAHVNFLPFLSCPLPIALAIIADYLQDNQLRLIDLFRTIDKNNDWLMTRDELKDSLRNVNMPLTEVQLDELLVLLDDDDDGNLSYKELAKGIEAYYQDRKWKRLKEMYDNMIDKDDSQKTVVSERMGLLNLAMMKTDANVASRYRRYQERTRRSQRRNKPVTSPKEVATSTMEGNMGARKLKYLEHVNEECRRCINRLEEEGIFFEHVQLKRVLVPPYDKTKKHCQQNLDARCGLLPRSHAKFAQKKLVNKKPESRGNSAKSSQIPLPRVATIDFKSRAAKARLRRTERETTSPDPCWPQQLTGKIRPYDDQRQPFDGKTVHFYRVENKIC